MTSYVYERESGADPAAAWDLLARPREWSRWAPHLRGTLGLGSRELAPGYGAVLVGGFIPVPVRVTAVTPGRSWTWRVGLVEFDHRVEPRPHGSRVAIEMRAPRLLLRGLRVSYGPIVETLLGRLARIAEEDSRPTGS